MRAKLAVFAVLSLAALSGCASMNTAGTEDVTPSETAAIDVAPVPASRPSRADRASPAPRSNPAARAASAAPTPRGQPEDDEPLDRATANGKCWMKVDQNTKLSLEQKAAAVGKCTDDMLAQDRIKRAE